MHEAIIPNSVTAGDKIMYGGHHPTPDRSNEVQRRIYPPRAGAAPQSRYRAGAAVAKGMWDKSIEARWIMNGGA